MTDFGYAYNDHEQNPDPAHQPYYLSKMLQRLSAAPNVRTILDAGCGDGNFAGSLSEAGYVMYGLEMSDIGLAIADKRGVGWFKKGSVYDDLRAPFPGVASFDAVIAVDVIEHLYSPRHFVDNAFAALRPGGILILTCPYWGYLKTVFLALSGRVDRYHTALWDGGHIKHWSKRTLTELVTERGFVHPTFDGASGRPPLLWTGMIITAVKPDL
jgi:SAM-dependent methyltransferase